MGSLVTRYLGSCKKFGKFVGGTVHSQLTLHNALSSLAVDLNLPEDTEAMSSQIVSIEELTCSQLVETDKMILHLSLPWLCTTSMHLSQRPVMRE